MGLQFNLWSVFREWGESTDDAEWPDDQDEMLDDAAKLRKAVNLGKLYGSLVAEGVVSLQILKVAPHRNVFDNRCWDSLICSR
jgi:nucleolar MIF4G domain-containing protein 1